MEISGMLRLLFDENDEKYRLLFSPTGENEAFSFPNLGGRCKCVDTGGAMDARDVLPANAGIPIASRKAYHVASNPPAPIERAEIARGLG